MNLNRLTEKAQEAVVAAQQLAARLNHSQIDPEHLLSTLVAQENGIVPAVVSRLSANAVVDLGGGAGVALLRRLGQFVVQRDELVRQLVARVHVDHRPCQIMRFLDLHRGAQIRLQHRQALIYQLLHEALRQVGPGLELVDDDATDLEIAVVVGLDLLHVLQQRVEGTPREVVAVEGD